MDKNLLMFLEAKTKELDENTALGIRSKFGWTEMTYKGVSILAQRLGGYLLDECKIGKGDKVAILSESNPEWSAAFFSIVIAGGTIVPLDIKLTEYELNSILSDCLPKVLLVSSAYFETGLKMKEQIPSIERIVLIDDKGVNKEYDSIYTIQSEPRKKWVHRSLNQTALIIYTSGTTGMPKGVQITYKNMITQTESISKCFPLTTNDRLLSILPMNHLFELSVGYLTFLSLGTSIYYSKSLKPKDLFEIIQKKRITFMVVVPAFLKLLKTTLDTKINQFGPIRRFLFELKYRIAPFIPWYKVRRMMFKTVQKNMGGKFRGFISGGAPLDVNIAKFFNTVGIEVFEGYGLSEASPVVSLNTKGHNRLGSVGKPIPGVEARVDKETGELQVKGPNIMKGYYKREDLTANVMTEDGWLKTGDIAKIDNDGYIWITGRIKNMIVLSGGKKVFPEEVEAVMEKNPKFAEICVFGGKRTGGQKDGSEDVVIKIVPTEDLINSFPDDKDLEKEIIKEVKDYSKRLSNFKRPTSIIISKEPLPRTATNKVKRKEIKQEYDNK
ncbi:AMP-binding protein [bacterium]|nr:AMP-binding protein [bacterium]